MASCEYRSGDWETKAYTYGNFETADGIKSFGIFKDTNEDFYYSIKNLAEVFGVKYSGLKDTSDVANAVFKNTTVVLCEGDEEFPDEHFCRLDSVWRVLNDLNTPENDKLIQQIKKWIAGIIVFTDKEKFLEEVELLDEIEVTLENFIEKWHVFKSIAFINFSKFSAETQAYYFRLIDAVKTDVYKSKADLNDKLRGVGL